MFEIGDMSIKKHRRHIVLITTTMIAITTTHTPLVAAAIILLYVAARQANFALCLRHSVCPSHFPSHGCTEAFPQCLHVHIFLECVESRQNLIGKFVSIYAFVCIFLLANTFPCAAHCLKIIVSIELSKITILTFYSDVYFHVHFGFCNIEAYQS